MVTRFIPAAAPGSRGGGIGVAEDDHRVLPARLRRHVLDPGVRRVPLDRPAGRSGPMKAMRRIRGCCTSARPVVAPVPETTETRPGGCASCASSPVRSAGSGAWSGALRITAFPATSGGASLDAEKNSGWL